MKSILPWRKKLSLPELNELEASLQATLSPVIPKPKFLDELRHQLMGSYPESIVSSKPTLLQTQLVIFAGLISGALLMITSLRALLTILAALGILHQANRQLKEKEEPVPVGIPSDQI